MTTSDRTFLPAAGHDWFLPVYDPLTKILGMDRARRRLLDQAALREHYRVLDVGCGTGTLAVLVRRLYPTVEVAALDPDPKALARARRKANRAGVTIKFDRGFADAMPYPDAAFDRVFSSMMLHHLEEAEKQKALLEFRRVLVPGGRLEFVDFTAPATHRQGALSRMIHSHHRLNDNSEARILDLFSRAGFVSTTRTGEQGLFFGSIAFYQATVGFRD